MLNIDELDIIYESLKNNKKDDLYIDKVLNRFRDNQIDVEGIKYLLSKENISLPDEFYELPKSEQKVYRQYKMNKIDVLSDVKPIIHSCYIYNKVYFYDLVKHARQNKEYTERLIKYVNELQDMSLFIIAMKNIYLDNLDYFNNSVFNCIDFKKEKCYTLFDLLNFLELNKKNIKYSKAYNYLYNFFDYNEENKLRMKIDFGYKYNEFIILIEFLIIQLFPKEKELNDIKIRFLLIKKEYLKNGEYHIDSTSGMSILQHRYNEKIKEYNKNKNNPIYHLLKRIKEFIKENDINDFPPNGYKAICYILLQLKEEDKK